MPVSRHILEQIKQIIPPLNGTLHKGQSGRVGVLGGARDYSGAPYFAAISALRLGADLSHVICSPTAAGSIKSYSPDLIVHPILEEGADASKVKDDLSSLLSRLHCLIIGPGLGREDYMLKYAREALLLAKSQGMFIVLDADGLYMIGKDLSLVKGYRRAVLTPNIVEFKRLSEAAGIDKNASPDELAGLVSRALGGVTILQKGANDIIANDTTGEAADKEQSKIDPDTDDESQEKIEVDVPGGLKRCGGQGDILSGNTGTMLAWAKCYEDGTYGDPNLPSSRMPILAATGASMVTRAASRRAFLREGRGVITADMLGEIGGAFANIFGEDAQGKDESKL